MTNNYHKYTETAELLKALSHPVRICIVRNLLKQGQCNVSHMQDCLDIPQSTVSQHLQKLKAAGIIEGERNGLEIYYTIKNDLVKKLFSSLFTEVEEKHS